jgi:hypothetical protein
MANFPHTPILTFRAYVEGDWRFKDPSMVRAELPPEIAHGYDYPKEVIVCLGEKQLAVLDLGLGPGLESTSKFLDEKMRLIIAKEESDIPGEPRYVFDQEILYKEALAFAESVLSNADRILLDITVENLPVFKILEERRLLVLPAEDPIGKEAIYYLRKR